MLIDLHLRDDLLENFPNFEYFNAKYPEKLDFSRLDNTTGQQQESFINFWVIKRLKENPVNCGLDLGCGQNIHLACLGINDYAGPDHPTYRGEYKPHITSKAENVDKIFNPGTFSFVVASHILEHVQEPAKTFRAWCNLLMQKGIMILLCPDSRYEQLPGIGSWDPTHINFFTPKDFEEQIIKPNEDILIVEEFNTLSNKFSMNLIGRKR